MEKQIVIRTTTGRSITIAIEAHDSMKTIKMKIEEKEGMGPNNQRLIYPGKELKEGAAENNIMKGSIIHLCLKLKGGMMNSKSKLNWNNLQQI